MEPIRLVPALEQRVMWSGETNLLLSTMGPNVSGVNLPADALGFVEFVAAPGGGSAAFDASNASLVTYTPSTTTSSDAFAYVYLDSQGQATTQVVNVYTYGSETGTNATGGSLLWTEGTGPGYVTDYRGDTESVRNDDFVPLVDITGHAPPTNSYWDRNSGQFLPISSQIYFEISPEVEDLIYSLHDNLHNDWKLGRVDNACYAYAQSMYVFTTLHPLNNPRYTVYTGFVTNWWGPMGVQLVLGNSSTAPTDGGLFIHDSQSGARLYIHALPMPLGIQPRMFVEEYIPTAYFWPSLQPPNLPD